MLRSSVCLDCLALPSLYQRRIQRNVLCSVHKYIHKACTYVSQHNCVYIYTRACLSLLVLYIRMYLRAYMYTCMHLHIQLHAHVLADIYELCLPLSLPSNCIKHSDMATGNQSMSTPPAQHELSHRSHSLAIRATSYRGPVDVNDFSDKDDKHYKFGLGIPQHPGPLDSESVSYVVRYWLQVKRFRQAHLCK